MKYKFELRVDRLLDALNLAGMAVPARLGDTYVLYFRDQAAQRRAAAVLEQLEIEQMGQRLFTVRVAEEYVSLMRKVKDRSLEGMSFVAPGFQRLQFDDLFENRGFLDSGIHHPEGILILFGRGVRRGIRLGDSVGVDVAPTLLALAGLPVARDQDGRVLVEAIDPDFLTVHPIRFIESYEESYARSESPAEEAAKSTAEEDAVLRERLRGLGYL
jgi:arylsulfatase A-like enzyme